jgi:hypothetical protein
MPTFGISSTFGLTPPDGYELSVEVATIKDKDGKVVEAMAKPLVTKTVTIRTKGAADLTNVHQGSISGTLVVTSSKVSQTNDDFSTSEITGNSYA